MPAGRVTTKGVPQSIKGHMNNVIEFPHKVFQQWGAIAQVLTPYLQLLGATKADAQEIIIRLKLQWEQLGVAPGASILRSVPAPLTDEQNAPGKEISKVKALHTTPNWKSQNVRTMLEFAKLEHQLFQTS
jgi:hypothetical protein